MFTSVSQAADTSTAFTSQVSSHSNGVVLTLHLDLTQLKYDSAGGGAMTLPGFETTRSAGSFALPRKTMTVVLPPNVSVTGCDIQATPVVWSTSTLSPLALQTYASLVCEQGATPAPLPARYPEVSARLLGQGYHHGVHVQEVVVNPVQLDLVTGQIFAASEIVVRLTWAPASVSQRWVTPSTSNVEAQRARTTYVKDAVNGSQLATFLAASAAMTAEVLPTYIPNTPTGTVVGVILAPQTLLKYYQAIAVDKTRAGSPWEVVTYEWIDAQAAYQQGAFTDQPARIREFLIEAYQRYGLEFVLFGGTPPYIPATWDRAWWGSGWEQRHLEPHRSFGYYTNLDGGHHHEVTLNGQQNNLWVTMHPNGTHTFRGSGWVPQAPETFTTQRCGYLPYYNGRIKNLKTALGGHVNTLIGLTINPIVTTTPEARTYWSMQYFLSQVNLPSLIPSLRSAHPELIGQEILLVAEGSVENVSTCDRYPELTAGWLPPDPNLGGIGVGLYHAKVRAYREPRDPNGAGTGPSGGSTGTLLKGMYSLLNTVNNCSSGGTSVLRNFNMDSFQQALQPMGLLVEYGCSFQWWGHAVAGPYWSGMMTPLMLHPDGGPVVTAHDGMGAFGGYHEGPAANGVDLRTTRIPLGPLALLANAGRGSSIPDWMSGRSGHQAIIYGDPSLLPFVSNQIVRPVVTHPTAPQSSFGVTLSMPDGQPFVGALVVVSKRRPNGSYALYQRQATDSQGVAFFNIGAPADLGSGVIAVEVDQYPPLPTQDFYPYHGVIPLPGNRPPVVVSSVPTVVQMVTPQGTWVIFDVGDSYDPDGDLVTSEWSWTDNRTGTPVARQGTGRWIRVFLPPGTNQVGHRATDGYSAVSQTFTIAVEDLSPPVVTAQSPAPFARRNDWVTVPIRLNQTVSGGLRVNASDPQSGIGGWAVTSVTTNDPRQPAPVTFSLDPSGPDLRVLTELNQDGNGRVYTVGVQVWNTVGLTTSAVGHVLVDFTPPIVMGSSVVLTQRSVWVEVPVKVNAGGNGLNFSVSDLVGLAGWTLTSVTVNDPRQPAPVNFTLKSGPTPTLRVFAEPNEDLTTRVYTVTLQAWDQSGFTATGQGEIAIASSNSVKVEGTVVKGRVDATGGLIRPPVAIGVEPDALVELVTSVGETLRAQADAQGRWSLYMPTSGMITARASKGGRMVWLDTGSQFTQLASAGVTLRWDQIYYNRQWYTTARPAGNQAPMVGGWSKGGNSLQPLVTLDARGSGDPDGDLLTYEWRWTLGGVEYVRTSCVVKDLVFPFGSTLVTLTVSDGATSSSTEVEVVRTTGTKPQLQIMY